MEQKGKSILGVISDVLLVILIVVAIAITVMTFTSKSSETGIGNVAGYTPFSVQTDSMSPTIGKGDLIIAKEVINPQEELKVGDVITFYTLMQDGAGNTVKGFNTHRILDVQLNNDGSVYYYVTKGDAMETEDNQKVYPDDIVARQIGAGVDESGNYVKGLTISGFGNALDFLQSQLGFMICVIIPLALFFIWQVYKLIAMFMTAKAEKISDDVKRQAIEEYLAQQEAEKKSGGSDNGSEN
ncbi:MAG: signal peptidase I [Clostridia bacterium]|nr:signal peptidase I [Clostridia bacterium]MBQ7862746.1 signal peptidase I [Clostridia bacterium]